MATLSDLLDNFGLTDVEGPEQEKVASADGANLDEQALLENLLQGDGQTKTASEGDSEMGSLANFYMNLTAQDELAEDDAMDKVAELAAQDLVQDEVGVEKIAAEYDAAGRILARGFVDELNKIAREIEDPSKAALPALGERGTGYQMETNYAEKGPIKTKGGEKQHQNILKGKAEGPAGKAEAAMGPQFATAQMLYTNRAQQTGAK